MCDSCRCNSPISTVSAIIENKVTPVPVSAPSTPAALPMSAQETKKGELKFFIEQSLFFLQQSQLSLDSLESSNNKGELLDYLKNLRNSNEGKPALLNSINTLISALNIKMKGDFTIYLNIYTLGQLLKTNGIETETYEKKLKLFFSS